MTAQIGERIIYEGEEHSMCEEPLFSYFHLGGKQPKFGLTSTALWRGYVGTWEVLDDRLYLVALEGSLEDGSAANLETVFPGFPTRVFAHWYSGTIRIPQGKLLDYVHMGYESVYERDLLLTFDNGVHTGTEVKAVSYTHLTLPTNREV